MKTNVVDFANGQRELLMAKDQDQSFFMTCDGEEVQIASIINDDVANELDQNNIDVGKGAAACSGTVGNALDRSNLFKSAKKVLKCSKKNKEMTKLDLSDNALNEKLIESMKRDHSNLSAAKRAMIAEALVRIVKALSKVMNFSITQHGFERTGLYVDRGDGTYGPSFEIKT